MTIRGIAQLQVVQMESGTEKQKGAREDMANDITEHQAHVNDSYDQAMKEIEKNKAARETKGFGALLGTIIGGPIIGTAIGDAIGGWANDGDEADAREAKRQTEFHDIFADRAYEKFEDSRKTMEDAIDVNKQLGKFHDEIRDMGWNSAD